MEISSEYLADLLIGIAKAQTAVIDAMERANPGFRNTHAVPLLQVAANMRAGDPRLIDLPARVLLRMQGRVALDNDLVRADLERLTGPQPAVASDASAATAPRPATRVRAPAISAAAAAPAASARAPAPAAATAPARAPAQPAAAPARPAPTPAAAPAPGQAAGGDNLDFSARR